MRLPYLVTHTGPKREPDEIGGYTVGTRKVKGVKYHTVTNARGVLMTHSDTRAEAENIRAVLLGVKVPHPEIVSVA